MAESSLSASDPWDWTVDQVIFALTNPESPLLSANIHLSLPKLTIFAAHLKERDVTGLALLTKITSDYLRDELGIKSLGQTVTLSHLIRQVQGTSLELKRQTRRSAPLWSGSFISQVEAPSSTPNGEYASTKWQMGL